ncbi:MAG: hypothetical protein JJU02_06385, partial [Cryomorphaceae bacterium]|nr:hypothetical protein [Cryomorphaceae bacterium]
WFLCFWMMVTIVGATHTFSQPAYDTPRARDGSGSPPNPGPYSGASGGGCDGRSRPRTPRRCGPREGGYSGQPGAAPRDLVLEGEVGGGRRRKN